MSATSAVSPRSAHRERPPLADHPAAFWIVVGTIALDVGILAAGAFASRDSFASSGVDLLVWAVAVVVVGAASLSFESGHQLGLDMPLLLGAGFLYGPVVAGVIAAVAYMDPREFRHEVPVMRAFFNRAQTSLSVMAGTVMYRWVAGDSVAWPIVVVAAVLAVAVDSLVNYGIVAGVLSLHDRVSYSQALSQLHFGTPVEFGLTWFGFGLLSLTLAETYKSVGPWSLVIFAIPLVLARQALVQSGRLDEVTRRVEVQSGALLDVSATIADERRDERLALAAGLHDEVLPPLYKVHLMGQVLRQDLASGRLLALEDDLPELLRAADNASESMRTLIRRLQNSPLGRTGLPETLRLLVDYLRQESGLAIELRVSSAVRGTPLAQLLLYQVAREAIQNAVRHSRAKTILATLDQSGDELSLVVEDDGVGFVPAVVDRSRHFGIELMRERVELSGGSFRVESTTGTGTRVTARIPSGGFTQG